MYLHLWVSNHVCRVPRKVWDKGICPICPQALQEGLAEVSAYAASASHHSSSPLPQSQPGKRLARLVYETGGSLVQLNVAALSFPPAVGCKSAVNCTCDAPAVS